MSRSAAAALLRPRVVVFSGGGSASAFGGGRAGGRAAQQQQQQQQRRRGRWTAAAVAAWVVGALVAVGGWVAGTRVARGLVETTPAAAPVAVPRERERPARPRDKWVRCLPPRLERDNTSGVEPVVPLRGECEARGLLRAPPLAETLESKLGSKCAAERMPFAAFACAYQCERNEPELERTVRDMRMAEHGGVEHVVSLCVRRIAPALVWYRHADRKLLWTPCVAPQHIPERELVAALKLIAAVLCVVQIPAMAERDVVWGFDPQDYAVPTHGAKTVEHQYAIPLPALMRFVGTKMHSGLLFPTTSHVVAAAHCDFRRQKRWWRLCTAHESIRDSLPFHARNKSVMWRGAATGVPWSPSQWRFQPRARLVREFGHEPGFDVGFVRKMKRVANTSADLREEMEREWVRVPHIVKEDHPKWAALIHVDGNTASWGSSHKLNSGSVVMWVESVHDYREHYYAHLVPWVHYVPIAPDMSDLRSARDWFLAHPAHAEKLARNAAHLFDTRLRAADLYCYVARLVGSIASAQVRSPTVNATTLRTFLGDDLFRGFRDVSTEWA